MYATARGRRGTLERLDGLRVEDEPDDELEDEPIIVLINHDRPRN